MQIDIKGRNVTVTDELRARLERRLAKVSRQVSELARLEVEIYEERNPSIADRQVAEATLYLKGATLRARDASPDMDYSLKLAAEELARQVKRHRVKRRHRREAHAAAAEGVAPGVEPQAESQPSG
ncbi:MAG TPA: ribosome-associated translation inhibitor RaiA [Solirubrobacteraceae bacterium]|nr:ribosome-associated translation inhibitor RaiA [Solirubrobacteraceae bacterium]